MSGIPINYSNSIGIGCGLYDAIQTRLGLNRPALNTFNSYIRNFASGVITAGATWGIPIYLNKERVGYPYMAYINPTLRWRMVASMVVNGGSFLRYGSATCYHVIKGENSKAKDHFKTACKFFWRVGLDASLLNFAPVKALEYAMIAEAVANVCIPSFLRNGLVFISRFIDNRIIGSTSDERNRQQEDFNQVSLNLLPNILPAYVGSEEDSSDEEGPLNNGNSNGSGITHLTSTFLRSIGGLWRLNSDGTYSKVNGRVTTAQAAGLYTRTTYTRHPFDNNGYLSTPKPYDTFRPFNPSTWFSE